MSVQSGSVENVRDDAQTLSEIVARSQGAEGSLQVSQATNQLLALATKQQFQLQNLMAAQFRTESLEAARRGQRSEEHTSELQSLMRISYAVFCLKQKKTTNKAQQPKHPIQKNCVCTYHKKTKRTTY